MSASSLIDYIMLHNLAWDAESAGPQVRILQPMMKDLNPVFFNF